MKKIAILVLSIFLLITVVSAQEIINRTAMTDVIKNNDGTFTTKYYMGAVNMPDIDGNYKPFSEVVDISWNNGNIVYTWYDKEVRLQPFVIYNNNRYNILQIRQAFPNINLSTYLNKNRGNNKFGFNITNIPDSIKNNISYIVFELISSSNLTWDDVSRDGYNLYITDNLKLSFKDLIDSGFTLNFINKTYLAIGNVSGKNNLWLDPTITYNFNATYEGINSYAYKCEKETDSFSQLLNQVRPQCDVAIQDITLNSTLDSNDDVWEESGSQASAAQDWQIFEFFFNADSILTILNQTLAWEGKDSANDGEWWFLVWNPVNSNWTQLDNLVGTLAEVTKSYTSLSSSELWNSSGYSTYLIFHNADVGTFRSTYTDYVTLNITYNDPPAIPILNTTNNTLFSTSTPILSWNNATSNGGGGGNVTYHIQVDNNSDFTNIDYENFSIREKITPTNITSSFLNDSTYYWRVRSTNSFGTNSSFSNFSSFRIDTAPPIINITTPINGTTLTSTSVNINYSVSDSDGNLNTCRWTQDGGISNTTLTCGVNITATFADGVTHNVTIYADDTAGNLNLSTVTFIISVPGGVGSSGGGGGDITTTVIQNTTWIIVTDTRSSKFDFTIPPGGLRERKIIFNNLESVEANIQIKCEDIAGDLCQYVKFNNPNEDTSLLQETFLTQMTLTNTTNEEKIMDFILDLPNNLTEGIYDFNIVGIDQLGNRETISVRVRIDSGIFTILIDKLLGSTRLSFLDFISKDIKAINILLLFLPLIILIPSILIIFAKLPYKNILAITISFATVIIIFIFLD